MNESIKKPDAWIIERHVLRAPDDGEVFLEALMPDDLPDDFDKYVKHGLATPLFAWRAPDIEKQLADTQAKLKHSEMAATAEAKEVDRLRTEMDAEVGELNKLTSRLSYILTGVANALKGEPEESTIHSYHDLIEVAIGTKAKLEAAERAATLSCENCVRDPVSCEWIRVCIARGFKHFVLKPSLKALTQEDKGHE
jgi:hypothetical protein